MYHYQRTFILSLIAWSILYHLAAYLAPSTIWVSILGFGYILMIPGLLLMNIFRYQLSSMPAHLGMGVAISTTIAMTWGLMINLIIPLVSDTIVPLSSESLHIRFGLLIASLSAIALWRSWSVKSKLFTVYIPWEEYSYLVLMLVSLTLVILGANQLNAIRTSILPTIGLAISGITLTIVAIRARTHSPMRPWILWLASIGLLWSLSLRANYVGGWDINEELRLYLQTRELGRYNMWYAANAYNACLSITILPTVLESFIKISPHAILKIIFPLIFSFVPVLIMELTKRLTSSYIGYLAAFYIIAQPYFIQPMTGIARQEIAFILFSALLLTIFSPDSQRKSQKILSAFLGLGMVFAHYSTTYVALGLFICTYISSLIYRNTDKQHVGIWKMLRIFQLSDKTTRAYYHLSFVMIVIWLVWAGIWYGRVTQTSQNLSKTAQDVLANINNLFISDVKGESVAQSLAIFAPQNTDPQEVLQDYSESVTNFFTNTEPKYESEVITQQYSLYTITPLTKDAIIDASTSRRIHQVLQILKFIFKIFVLLGAIALFFWKFAKSVYYKEYLIVMLFAWAIIALMLVHPTLAMHYNLSRLYLQVLLLLSVACVWGGLASMAFLSPTLRHTFFGILLGLLWLYQHGLTSSVIGGFAPMNLYNQGEDYDKFYVHREEVLAAEWLSQSKQNQLAIFADEIGNLRTLMSTGMRTLTTVVPATIYQDSYVYARYTNIKNGTTQASFDGQQVLYVFPQQFLETNKNVIYDNSGSRIYR